MTTERHQRIRAAFEAASSLPLSDQTEFVRRQAGDDLELAEAVLRLLRASREGDKFLAKPLFPPEVPNALSGMRIGAYQVVREIGAGGMGVVYLATRADDAFRRTTALKVIRAGLSSQQMIDHFLRERQILADLDHPNIARIVDGGTTPDGLPYFVMDYVDGRPIDIFANDREANVDQRLNLFRQACQAVSYLHGNRIIHRDLKPANMLVTSGGTVKLLDFGIAKLLDADPASQMKTIPMLTRGYASPEQLDGKPTGVGSDIYSLGAVLYELLTGKLPRDLPTESGPSTKLTGAGKTIRKPSVTTRTNATFRPKENPDELRRRLQGDLDSILMKALRDEPEQRYATVAEFVADIEHYQARRPVAARDGARLYVVSRYTRRNRMGIAAVTILAASLSWGGWEDYRAHQLRGQMDSVLASERLQAERLVDAPSKSSSTPAPQHTSPSKENSPTPKMMNPEADNGLRETLRQIAENYRDTFPKLVDNPVASRQQSKEILGRDLEWLQAITPLAQAKPDLSTALGNAYLQVAQAQWSAGQPSLNDAAGSSETCKKAVGILKSIPEAASGTDEVRALEGELNQQMSILPSGHS